MRFDFFLCPLYITEENNRQSRGKLMENNVAARKNDFYISGMTEDINGGIFHCSWQNNCAQVRKFYPLERNLCLCWSPDKRTIYASSQHAGVGFVSAYAVDENGALELKNSIQANGKSVCFLQTSGNGRFLYSANYASGNISEFTIGEDGAIADLKQSISHTGCSIHAEQTSPHPHCCTFTPDNRFLCVADLGADKILLYAFDAEKGISPVPAREYAVQPGAGPRHLIFDRDGRFAYLLCELGNSIMRFRYCDGEFEFIDTVSTLPHGAVNSSASTLKFSSNGKFLYAGNRGHDSLAVYSVDLDGKLAIQRFYSSGGSSPRDCNILDDIMIVTNEFSGEAAFFKCDENSGSIFDLCGRISLPRPLYVLI